MSGPVDVLLVCGLSCFNCDEESPQARTNQAMEEEAYYARWMLGLQDDAQAYYACPDCAALLYGATPAWPVHWTSAQCATADRAALARVKGGQA